jgi:hypothetical protein
MTRFGPPRVNPPVAPCLYHHEGRGNILAPSSPQVPKTQDVVTLVGNSKPGGNAGLQTTFGATGAEFTPAGKPTPMASEIDRHH